MPAAALPADDFASQVRAASVRELFTHSAPTIVGSIFMIAFIAATMWTYGDHPVLLAWVAAGLTMIAGRATFVRTFLRREPPDAALPRWERGFIALQGIAGVYWGMAGILFLQPDQPTTVALVLLCVAVGAAAAVPAQAFSRPAFAAFCVPTFALCVVHFAAVGGATYWTLAIASALFCATLLGLNRVQARTVTESLRIRFENSALLAALTQRTEEAEASRRTAEAASLAKSQFLAAASHDLRQPLYALGLFSATLRELELDETGRAVVARIGENLDAMERLFSGLLDLSRLQAGTVEVRPAPVSVATLFDGIERMFFAAANEKGLELRFRHDDEWVISDPVLIEQLMTNLVANAVRYTARGAILVAARRRGAAVRLEVWDSGIGIADADRVRIFEEFVQIGNAERDREKGLGLGLSIVARGAALLGTQVELASRVGGGSRFAIQQDATASPVHTPAAAPGMCEPVRFEGRVLVVEDEHNVREGLVRLLSSWGLSVVAVAVGAQAVARVRSGERYDAVISDQRLSGDLDGVATIVAIRAAHGGSPPSAVLVTGDFETELLIRAQASDIPVLHKPVSAERLRTVLTAALTATVTD